MKEPLMRLKTCLMWPLWLAAALLRPTPAERDMEQRYGVMPWSAQCQVVGALYALSTAPCWYALYCHPIMYAGLIWALNGFVMWRLGRCLALVGRALWRRYWRGA
jgi:hypothetical protein